MFLEPAVFSSISKETPNVLGPLDQAILSLGTTETLASVGKLMRKELVGGIRWFMSEDGSRPGFRNLVL